MFGLGGQEVLIIVILVVILLFGATRLPKLGRSVGQSIRGFKKGLTDDVPDDEDDTAKGSKRDAKAANKDDAES